MILKWCGIEDRLDKYRRRRCWIIYMLPALILFSALVFLVVSYLSQHAFAMAALRLDQPGSTESSTPIIFEKAVFLEPEVAKLKDRSESFQVPKTSEQMKMSEVLTRRRRATEKAKNYHSEEIELPQDDLDFERNLPKYIDKLRNSLKTHEVYPYNKFEENPFTFNNRPFSKYPITNSDNYQTDVNRGRARTQLKQANSPYRAFQQMSPEVDINPPKQKQKNNQQNGNIHRGFIEYFPSHQLELPFYPKNDPHQSPSSNRVDPNSIPINEAQMAQSDQISEDFYTGKISPRQKSLTIMSPIEIATQRHRMGTLKNQRRLWKRKLRPSFRRWERKTKHDGNSDESPEESQPNSFQCKQEDAETIRKRQARLMRRFMNATEDPCNDFYQYACGNWNRYNPIPKDKSGYDTFEMLRDSLYSVLRDLLEEAGNENEKDCHKDAIVKTKHLYESCMNYKILENRAEEPLIRVLGELGGWPVLCPDWDPQNFDWLLLTAQLRLYNYDILISEWVGLDIKNSEEYIIQLDQTSLGLPSREYFLDSSNELYLNAYKKYMINIAKLLGASVENATRHAEELIDFETKLAKITTSPRRNINELYQRMTLGSLRKQVPQINWLRYMSLVFDVPVSPSEPILVFSLKYFQDLVTLLGNTKSSTIADYLLWRFVRHCANILDDRFQEAKQRFNYILFGRVQAPPRWKNCISQVNSNMGMAVGAMFVQKYFDENSKNDTLDMTLEIMNSFRGLLEETTWIDSETKMLAEEKLDAMTLRIGYPDFILNPEQLNDRYKDVVILREKYFENTLNFLQLQTRVGQDRLGKPVNKTQWNTAPTVVNANYNRNKNQIMFPAGILQPPFYHRYFPRSLNFGGIGVVIGHEITHGFDDNGRLFDKYGNLHKWWKDEAIQAFQQRAQCIIDQYSHYTVQEVDLQIDGINTQGENIADNGGIKEAFKAYKNWANSQKTLCNETLPGFKLNGEQLFFLNFAQVWCEAKRPEAARNNLKTAIHSPGRFRVIGTLSNSEDFAAVFNCPSGSPMNPVEKCSVW